MTANPIDPNLVKALQSKEISMMSDPKERSKKLCEFGMDKDKTMKIWGIDEENNSNIMIDVTKGIQYLNEIKDSVVSGLNTCTVSGVLCNEPVIGVEFNLHDAKLHADAIHRGLGQILPAAQRSMYASMLTASPRLMEPIYIVDIQCPTDVVSKIYSVIGQRRGMVIEEEHNAEFCGSNIKAYLPVAESIGFTQYLREETGGKAFPQCSFSHWEIVNDDPLVEGSKANKIVKDVRRRKGLSENIMPLSHYLDKL